MGRLCSGFLNKRVKRAANYPSPLADSVIRFTGDRKVAVPEETMRYQVLHLITTPNRNPFEDYSGGIAVEPNRIDKISLGHGRRIQGKSARAVSSVAHGGESEDAEVAADI